ncbi:MAG TPA: hypothetical protein VNT55_10585 [Baekduia sp.]|nr:hypothetical protein [Baekduia sp.]
MRSRLLRAVPALAVLLLMPAAASAADTVVAGNQIVQGFQCVGAPCADGEAMAGPKIFEKSDDTPGIRLLQTGVSFAAQTWDVAGNEANFFIRDLTGGSRLPFRIRPGAPTSSIDIAASGEVSTAGVVQQTVGGLTPLDAVDGDATLAPQDVAAIALAAVKALDARVSTLALTPGPKGDSGAAGAKGDAGATGAAGPTANLAAATARIATLERSNKKLAKDLATLKKQVKKLAKSSAKAHRSSAPGANGR